MSENTKISQEAPPEPPKPGSPSEAGASHVLVGTSSVSTDNADRPLPIQESSPSSGLAAKDRQRFSCDLCKVDCSSKQHLQSHVDGKAHKRRLNIVEGDKLIKEFGVCIEDDKEDPFASEECIEKVAENIWRCAQCDIIMIKKTCIREHIESHETGVKPYKCELCNLQCKSEKAFQDHVHGRKHRRVQLSIEENEKLEKDLNVTQEGLKSFGLDSWRCTPCFIQLGHPRSVRSHIISERHKNALSRHQHAST